MKIGNGSTLGDPDKIVVNPTCHYWVQLVVVYQLHQVPQVHPM